MSEQTYQEILQTQYNVKATSVTPFKSNVALVELEDGKQAIFKRVRTEKGGSFIDKFRFRNEIRMYKVLQASDFTYLNVPELFSAGKDHILIEYVEREEERNVSETDFVEAYHEMQNIQVPPAFFFDLFNQLTRGVWYRGLVVPIFSLTKYTGFYQSSQAAFLFLKLHLQSKRLKKRYWLHGDLAVRNVYYNKKNDLLFFIDFENMYYTRKWPFLEIVQKCFWYEGDLKESFRIDLDPIKQYLLETKKHKNLELLNINLEQQFRASLLISTISRILRVKSKNRTKAFKTFLEVLLNECAYKLWFQSFAAPYLNNSQSITRSVSIKELLDLINKSNSTS